MRGARSRDGSPRLAAAAVLLALCGAGCVAEAAQPAVAGSPAVGPRVLGDGVVSATAEDRASPAPATTTTTTTTIASPPSARPRRAPSPAPTHERGPAGTPRDELPSDTAAASTRARSPSGDASPPPAWFGTRRLATTSTGYPAPQPVPDGYADRRLWTPEELPPPPDDSFKWLSGPVPDDVLARSTWTPSCPVTLDELRYVRLSFWGFDGLHHSGELIAHRDAVAVLHEAFAVMHELRFPLERVRVAARPPDPPVFRGDDNTTTVFDCRPTTGGGAWSQHAYGLAIDINPFHNPYRRDREGGTVVLPAYASAYLDRDDVRPGMLREGDAVVAVFDAAGWGWGGRWRSLDDWQHFSASGR